ncbi:JAB domain-containing protein [Treponema pectinovorum]|uniref:JAB domain-containing protein n=1 Tax=Treponema pectinovorum TaxID=164 RepID=UPI0011CA68C2|nr:DNA repair protein RadC [Treponema pectinovorum]
MSKNKEQIDIRRLTKKNGLSYPNDKELIMLILGSGTKKMPVEYMSEEMLKVICAYNPEQWVEQFQIIEGVGLSKALSVAAALELGRRHNRNPQAVVDKPMDVVPFIKHYAMRPSEHFVCVTVNGAKEILNIRVLCIGAGNMAVLKPSEIFSEALKEHASGIILSHNHPGGCPEPSREDVSTTRSLCKAANILGLAVLDHIIITKNSYFSFLEHGLLPPNE